MAASYSQWFRALRNTACRLLAVASLAGAGAAHAAMVTYDGGTGYATGIDNLSLGGSSYHVDFVNGSYNSVYSSMLPMFLGDAGGANDAANAIMDTLNAELAVPEINSYPNEVLWVPFDLDASGDFFFATQTGHDVSSDPWQRYANFMGDTSTTWEPWYFAKFSAAPEPGTVGLLAAGLLGGLLLRRKRVA